MSNTSKEIAVLTRFPAVLTVADAGWHRLTGPAPMSDAARVALARLLDDPARRSGPAEGAITGNPGFDQGRHQLAENLGA